MIRAAIIVSAVLCWIAAAGAQSVPLMTHGTPQGQIGTPAYGIIGQPWVNGYVPSQADVQASSASKPDLVNGTPVSPRIMNSVRLPSAYLTDHYTGVDVGSYDPLGWQFLGPITISRNTNGEEHHAGGLEVNLNNLGGDPMDRGCANGGWYQNPTGRAVYGGRDIVGGCFQIRAAVPVAYHVPATFSNDPNTTLPQTTASSPAFAPAPTGIVVQGTLVTLGSPLTTSQVSQLRVGMVVQTLDEFTAVLTSWDPAGAWIKVDGWDQLGVFPVVFGQMPGTSGNAVTINVNTQVYGLNVIVEDDAPGISFDSNGVTPNTIGLEITNFHHGNIVTRHEWDEFNDTPRIWGMDVGTDLGGNGGGTGYVALGIWDKGFGVYGPVGYAGFLFGANSSIPQEAAYVSQQNGGYAFSVKPKNKLGTRTYQLRADTGSQQTGSLSQRQAIASTLFSTASTTPTTPAYLSQDGLADVEGLPITFSSNSQYSLDGTVACTNGASGAQFAVSGMWSSGANAAAAIGLAQHVTTLGSFGTVTGWDVLVGTDLTNWGPQLAFQGAAGVTCTAHVTTMQMGG